VTSTRDGRAVATAGDELTTYPTSTAEPEGSGERMNEYFDRAPRQPQGAPTTPAGSTSTLLLSMWRHKVLIVVATLLGIALGMALTTMQPTTYRAESRVFLSSHAEFDPTGQNDFVNDPSRFVEQQAAMMTSAPVLAAAIYSGAPADNVQELRQSLEVVASDSSDIVTVKATARNGKDAEALVNAVVRAYQARIRNGVAILVAQMKDVMGAAELQNAQRHAAVYGDGVSLVEPATAVAVSSGIRNATLLGLTGFLLAVGAGLIRDALPARARSRRRWGRTSSAQPKLQAAAGVRAQARRTSPEAS
jgi:uncharacterized protein involved in exopolysaccharide biosynthesis